jgi:hypothetical protein
MKPRSVATLKREALKAWGKVILSRDPVCVVCGKEKARHPHHIFPRARYRHLWFDLRNGAALCVGCHYRIHFDPMVPALKIADHLGAKYGHLELDAVLGRRRNPYGKRELENILVALQEVSHA